MFNISNDPDGSKLILGLLCFPEIYIKKVKKGQKQVKNGIFSCFLACFRLCLKDFVAEGDEITGRRPVHHERRAEGPSAYISSLFRRRMRRNRGSSPKATKSRAVGPYTMNDGPKARLYRFRRRRRRSTGRRPVYLRRRCKYFVAEGDEITGRRPVQYERRAEGPSK